MTQKQLLELWIDGELVVSEEVWPYAFDHRKKLLINMGNAQPYYWELVTYRKSKAYKLKEETGVKRLPADHTNRNHIEEALKTA